jgi:hypothetical protein
VAPSFVRVRRQPRPLRILTWHVHGNYLYYLTQAPHDFFLVTRPGNPPGHAGRVGALPWGDNVFEIDSSQVGSAEFDCVLYQSRRQWDEDRHTVLSAAQRRLPTIVLEHDAPYADAVDSCHWMTDPYALLVHVTHFNALMWNCDGVSTRVVEHGVLAPDDVVYSGELARGIVVVNHLARRGRKVGHDLFERVRRRVPLDLIGMASEECGGLGEVSNPAVPAFVARYRFFFHPIRWTSLGLAALEAMAVGVPVVGVASTELSTVIESGRNGYIDTNPELLISAMDELLEFPELARTWGEAARRTVQERFSIDRFVAAWSDTFAMVTA